MKDFSVEPNEKLVQFIDQTFRPEDDVLREIRDRSIAAGMYQIHVGPMDGLHLEVLTRMLGAKKAVEIGTLAGYSGVCIARGLAVSGKLYTFEKEPKNFEVAFESFRKAGVSEKVEMFLGPAIEKLSEIEKFGPFDLVFIDADKPGYLAYLDWAERNLRSGGAVIGDNTFAFGYLADENPPEHREAVRSMREFNRRLAQSGRFRSTILPTGEGLTVGIKV